MAKIKREQAQEFADQIAGVLGDNLWSLIMFGSAVRGGFGPGHSDVNLLLIVQDWTTKALRPIERSNADLLKRRSPAPLIFTEREWRASTDVFPIEIEDMRDAHELLRGVDPFDGLTTTRAHLRHELEREIRGKLLQLRAEYAAVAPDGKALTRLLIDSARTFFVLMRGTVRLTGGTPSENPASLVNMASEAAGLDETAFAWVVDKIAGRTVRALKPYDDIGARYVDELEKLADFVDRFDELAAAQSAQPATADDSPAQE